jgi:hypothetical protein
VNETPRAFGAGDPASPALVDPSAVLAYPVAAVAADADAPDAPSLPADLPQWQRDVVSISSRARAMLATIVPVVVRTLSYWDHRLRELTLGARTFSVDPAGCYRLR